VELQQHSQIEMHQVVVELVLQEQVLQDQQQVVVETVHQIVFQEQQ
jgi:hypothetical protein